MPASEPARTGSSCPTIIGLIGGVASGKSYVAGQWARQGAVVIDADAIGHAVLNDTFVREAARRQWGEEILTENGTVDRQALAKIVFAPPPDGPLQLQILERLTHPEIGRRIKEQIRSARERGVPAVVLDAAVLLKAGWTGECSQIVFVDAPREVRRARAAARGWSDAEFDRREAAQESIEAKRHAASMVLDNSLPAEQAQHAIDSAWQKLVHSTESA